VISLQIKGNKWVNFTLLVLILLKRSFLYLFCILSLAGLAQSRKRNFRQRELGFFGGGSYYIGDINPRGHFLASHAAAGAYFRYTTNYRYAFRFGLNYGLLSGNDADSHEADQIERNLSFRTKIYELYSVAEFNFVEYRIGHDRFKFTMFVFGGLGVFYFDPQASRGGGYESLRGYKTEAQGKQYPKFQVNIPFGVGIKWNIAEKCGLGLEWGPRRTFTDYIDDIKGSYPDGVGGDGNGFTDRTLNGGASPGSMRGNPSTKDWYFYYGLTINFKLPDPHPTCHGSFR
jgi:hypothetical protein